MIMWIFFIVFLFIFALITCFLIWIWYEDDRYRKEQERKYYDSLEKFKKPEEDITDL